MLRFGNDISVITEKPRYNGAEIEQIRGMRLNNKVNIKAMIDGEQIQQINTELGAMTVNQVKTYNILRKLSYIKWKIIK